MAIDRKTIILYVVSFLLICCLEFVSTASYYSYSYTPSYYSYYSYYTPSYYSYYYTPSYYSYYYSYYSPSYYYYYNANYTGSSSTEGTIVAAVVIPIMVALCIAGGLVWCCLCCACCHPCRGSCCKNYYN